MPTLVAYSILLTSPNPNPNPLNTVLSHLTKNNDNKKIAADHSPTDVLVRNSPNINNITTKLPRSQSQESIMAHERKPLLQQQQEDVERHPTAMSSSSSSSLSETQQSSVPSSSSSSSSGMIFIASLIALWYSSNIGVILLNKFLLSNYNFRFPIFLTMCHMSACAVFSYASIVFFRWAPLQVVRSRSQLVKIATLSVVFCGSVVGGNVSLRYLPVSFNQAVGATTPFFTAVLAYFVTLKREAWVTYAALVPVVAGVVIASGGEPSFHLFGFIMCISATAARAFKSVLQGVLLSSEGEKLNSMNLLLYMAPISVLVLLPASLIMEPNVFSLTLSLGREKKYLWPLLFVNASTAYVANLSNFLVTKHTSALTLQVLGNAKGAVAVVISILLFRNPVTVMGISGYAITVMGVVAYGQAKRKFK